MPCTPQETTIPEVDEPNPLGLVLAVPKPKENRVHTLAEGCPNPYRHLEMDDLARRVQMESCSHMNHLEAAFNDMACQNARDNASDLNRQNRGYKKKYQPGDVNICLICGQRIRETDLGKNSGPQLPLLLSGINRRQLDYWYPQQWRRLLEITLPNCLILGPRNDLVSIEETQERVWSRMSASTTLICLEMCTETFYLAVEPWECVASPELLKSVMMTSRLQGPTGGDEVPAEASGGSAECGICYPQERNDPSAICGTSWD